MPFGLANHSHPKDLVLPLSSKNAMERYKNLSGESGVEAYEIGADFVLVKFHDRPPYRYDSQRIGADNLARMKKLARAGEALCTFISQHPSVRDGYAR